MNSNPTRRSFLGSAAGAAAFGALAPQTPAGAQPPGDDLKLGVATYSLRMFQRPKAISIIKLLGTPYISVKEFHLRYIEPPEARRRARQEFERAGLKIMGGGTITLQKDDDDDIRFYFEYCKDSGIPMIIGAPSAKTLPRIEKFVQQYDIKLAIHNHGPEDKHFPTPQSALKLVKDMDPRIGLCIDVGHTTRTGTDVVESIREAGSRLLDLHIKDLKDLRVADSQCDVGDGAMPIVAIFKELKRMSYQGCVMLEYEINAEDPVVGMQRSFSYMRGVLAGLKG